MTKQRYTSLDVLRGLCIISMVVYHTVWDLCYAFDVRMMWFRSDAAFWWQRSIRIGFIIISGFCLSLGGRRLFRALTVLACGGIVTLVTMVIMPDDAIHIGVLTLIGTGMLLLSALDRVLAKLPPVLGLLFCAVLFLLTVGFERREIAFFGLSATVPSALYKNYFTAFLGFPSRAFSSSDYVPIFPWIFVFFAGYFSYRIFKKYGLLSHLCRVRCAPLEWLGRHSLIIYMLHQPIIYALLYVGFRIFA